MWNFPSWNFARICWWGFFFNWYHPWYRAYAQSQRSKEVLPSIMPNTTVVITITLLSNMLGVPLIWKYSWRKCALLFFRAYWDSISGLASSLLTSSVFDFFSNIRATLVQLRLASIIKCIIIMVVSFPSDWVLSGDDAIVKAVEKLNRRKLNKHKLKT